MKRSAKYKREKIHELLVKRGRFNMEYGRVAGKWAMPDKDFEYKKGPFRRAIGVFLRLIMFVFGNALIKLLYGAKVEGKENLKAVKGQGVICICNHFHVVDTLFVRKAVGHFGTYNTAAPINNKTGLGGAIMSCCGLLPFSKNRTALKNLDAEMGRLLSKRKKIVFYPEQSLWSHYKSPRPMKKGAFYYAVKFGVPVLPVFCTFDETKRGRIKDLVIHILPPVYGDGSLSLSRNAQKMLGKAEEEWRECFAASNAQKAEKSSVERADFVEYDQVMSDIINDTPDISVCYDLNEQLPSVYGEGLTP